MEYPLPFPMQLLQIQLLILTGMMKVQSESDFSEHLSVGSGTGQIACFQVLLRHHSDNIVSCPNVYQDA